MISRACLRTWVGSHGEVELLAVVEQKIMGLALDTGYILDTGRICEVGCGAQLLYHTFTIVGR